MISESVIVDLLTSVDVVDVGSGPVVALAHGAGGGVRENFEPLFDDVDGGEPLRFVGPHHPGSGETPVQPGPLSIELLADRVVAAGVRAGADRFPVIGLSLGAAVAVTAAVRHPEHVRALVLTVGLAHADPQVRSVVAAWRALDAAGDLDALAALLVLTATSPATLAGLSDDTGSDVVPGGHDAWQAAVDAVRAGYPAGGAAHAELVGRVDVRPLLPRIDVPTLVVVAGADRIVLPGTARSFGQIRGAEVIEYPDAGHIFTEPEAARWRDDVRAFLTCG